MTKSLARIAARHPWRTVAAWIAAIAVAVVCVGAFLGDNLTSEGHVTNDPESLRGYDLMAQRLGRPPGPGDFVVLRSESLQASDPAFQARLAALTGALAAAAGPQNVGRTAVSRDGHAVLVPLRLFDDGEVEDVVAAVEAANRDGFAATVTGEQTLDHDFGVISERDLQEGELRFGLPAAMIILVLAFGALVAAFLPLLLALVSIAVGLGLTALVAQQWELSLFVVNMLTGMGLALGIDYALFVVSRFREERAAGRDKIDAIAATGATASRAVLFSGSAFVLAMTGLLLVQSTIMRSLAAGAILVGIVSVVAALTLLPAIISLLGDRVNALRVPVLGRSASSQAKTESRVWSAIVGRVTRRPVLFLAAAVLLLLVLAAPALRMDIGGAGISTLPDSSVAKQGFLALQESFPETTADPALVVVDGKASEPKVRAAVDELTGALAADPAFGTPREEVGTNGDLVVLSVPLRGDVLADRAVAAVERLRDDLVPAAFDGTGARVLVTGTTAENIDYFDVMDRWLPIVLSFVLGLSFLLLTVAFRSIVVAATAIVLNLLSVGAAYGLLVLVFKEGVGADLLGFQQVDIVEAWIPLFLFAVLFGLSMDYQVFLLSRIRERYSQSGDTRDAVVFGVSSTGRIITGAALIIVAVFLGFAMGDLVMFQQMGFGVAVALLLDATIVRSILVPAAMTVLGERNWYLPRWLQWLPHVEVEGHEGPREAPATAPVAT
ncbi:MAG TPA: MMPL family transporter [Gaiellaceae bacterium]|nr:MMPL family transporter [Gaiellaceae bacterium]